MDFDLFLDESFNEPIISNEEKQQKTQQSNQNQKKNEESNENDPISNLTSGQKDNPEEKYSISNIDSSKKLSSIMAGKKARDKKRMYVQRLQARSKEIQTQINRYQLQIKKTKETLSKMLNSAKYNQNSITYSELQTLIQSEDPNQDRINLLLDMIHFRVGGCGIERQAKIDYFMKQLVNSLFPPLQRYLMYCCDKKIDIFSESTIDDLLSIDSQQKSSHENLTWTKQFLASLQLTQQQMKGLSQLQSKFTKKKQEVIQQIYGITEVKDTIKEQQKLYEEMISQIRSKLNPVQGAVWVLFSDRIRFKRQIMLDSEYDLYRTVDPFCSLPVKKIKKE